MVFSRVANNQVANNQVDNIWVANNRVDNIRFANIPYFCRQVVVPLHLGMVFFLLCHKRL